MDSYLSPCLSSHNYDSRESDISFTDITTLFGSPWQWIGLREKYQTQDCLAVAIHRKSASRDRHQTCTYKESDENGRYLKVCHFQRSSASGHFEAFLRFPDRGFSATLSWSGHRQRSPVSRKHNSQLNFRKWLWFWWVLCLRIESSQF